MIGIIGNAPVDMLARIDCAFMDRFALVPHQCTTIDVARDAALLAAAPWERIPGGCGANIATSLARLGHEVHFVAPFGEDAEGEVARDSLIEAGVNILEHSQPIGSQRVFALIDPAGERSFATFYHPDVGVPTELLLRLPAREALVIDGYCLLYPRQREAILAMVDARPADAAPILFCPNDVSVVVQERAACDRLIDSAAHVVMSRSEADALDPAGPEAVAEMLAGRGKSGAVTLGAEGALLFAGEERVRTPSALAGRPIVDSNGAGDAFTAGYAHGLAHGATLAATGDFAARCAAVLLQTRGARPPHDFASRVGSL